MRQPRRGDRSAAAPDRIAACRRCVSTPRPPRASRRQRARTVRRRPAYRRPGAGAGIDCPAPGARTDARRPARVWTLRRRRVLARSGKRHGAPGPPPSRPPAGEGQTPCLENVPRRSCRSRPSIGWRRCMPRQSRRSGRLWRALPPAARRRPPRSARASAIPNCAWSGDPRGPIPITRRAWAKFQAPGVYATTVTQPGFFRPYLLEQLRPAGRGIRRRPSRSASASRRCRTPMCWNAATSWRTAPPRRPNWRAHFPTPHAVGGRR